MARGKRTSPEKAALVMALNELGVERREIARRTTLSTFTVRDILSGDYGWGKITGKEQFKELREKQKLAIQVASMELSRKSLIQAEKKLDKASYAQSVMGFAILRDKERLDANESTANLAVSFTPKTLDVIKDALSARLNLTRGPQGENREGL